MKQGSHPAPSDGAGVVRVNINRKVQSERR